HLEFADVELPGGDVLFLAGDCFTARPFQGGPLDSGKSKLLKRYKKFARKELSKYREVFYVLGNHDFYGGIIEETVSSMRGFLVAETPHVKLLDDSCVICEGVLIIGS